MNIRCAVQSTVYILFWLWFIFSNVGILSESSNKLVINILILPRFKSVQSRYPKHRFLLITWKMLHVECHSLEDCWLEQWTVFLSLTDVDDNHVCIKTSKDRLFTRPNTSKIQRHHAYASKPKKRILYMFLCQEYTLRNTFDLFK